MSDQLQAYYAEVRAAEDEHFNRNCREGGPIGFSMWSADPDGLRGIDSRHGIQPDDPRVYSIAAYKDERRQIDQEWSALCKQEKWDQRDLDEKAGQDKWEAQWRHEARITDCMARHFPGLNGLHPRTVDSIPKLWAYITEYLSGILERHHRLLCPAPAGARPPTCDENVQQVYSLLHELQVPWAPEPPYLALTQPEVRDQLKRIANQLERDEAERRLAPPLAPPTTMAVEAAPSAAPPAPPAAAEETPAEGAAPPVPNSACVGRLRLAPLVGQIIGESRQGFQPAAVRLFNDTRGNALPAERIADLARLLHSSVGHTRPALVRAGYTAKEAAALTRQLMQAAGHLLVDGPSRASLSRTEDSQQHETTAISLANRIDDALNTAEMTAAGAAGAAAPAPEALPPQEAGRPPLYIGQGGVCVPPDWVPAPHAAPAPAPPADLQTAAEDATADQAAGSAAPATQEDAEAAASATVGDDAEAADEAPWPVLMAASDLARRLGMTPDAVNSFLKRHRKKYDDCYEPVEAPRKNEPRIMYRTADVVPFLKQLRDKRK